MLPYQVKLAATALLKQRGKLPERRRAELEAVVRAHLNASRPAGAAGEAPSASDGELSYEGVGEATSGFNGEISREALHALAAIDARIERPGFVPPEEALVRLLATQGDDALRVLAVSARRTFVEALAPRHMPVGWDIERGSRGQ